ncbi:MAG: hypothetical protein IPP71_11285 [Bacteroidetes bacterium]|nr:hypothetical protein [Bacteroidota bacterium]
MFKKITFSALIVLALIVAKQNISTGTTQPEPFSLPGEDPGFEPAVIITDVDAFEFANQYKAVFGQNGAVVSGGVITRDAIDAILATPNCNGISYKLCTDPTGRFAPANTVFLVLTGAKVTQRDGITTVEETGTKKYTSKQWCPPACMKFMIRNANGELVPQE